MTTLYHTPNKQRWFLVPSEMSLSEGALCVRRFAGKEQCVDDAIAAYEVGEEAAKAWLDDRFSAGVAKAGEAFGTLVSRLAARGASVPEPIARARPDVKQVLGSSPGDIYTDPARAQEAALRLFGWVSELLKPPEQAARDPKATFDALGVALKTAAARVDSRKQEAEAKVGKKLVRVGFFAELRHGDKRGTKLANVCRPEAHPDEAAIVRYLQQASTLIASPGPVRDVLAPELGYIGTASIQTDGVFCWPADLAHYVARYHIALPETFLAHGRARHWKHIPFDIRAVNL